MTHVGKKIALRFGRIFGLAAGHFEFTYRLSPIFRFGGGTNEVQRDIIAMFGLGLPR